MSWASEFPDVLLCRPTGLVVLTGLDTTYNAVHTAIWDSFCNNRRPDRVPLQFRVLGADHEYPKCKTKRTSYEWYMPRGVLKTGWMSKHLQQVPAVVVCFFDLDWDEVMWKERQMECATKVQIVRDSLSGRSTRVCVVLIQKNAPLPPGEDVVAAERAASLCSSCELSAKSLFVLPLTDHLLGYTIRLENAFYELSQSYYHTEARRVKSHKEFLNKTTHQLLYVRHQFKIAFFNELKQDSHTALKHYKQAYGHMLELRMHDTNILEVKTIGGYINYKICRLSFQHNSPLDAISQFRKHIDYFKSRAGNPELAFENCAWMSKQFQVFGDLFDEAIKLGLTAIQTQHPGFYYQQAASHATVRKQLVEALKKNDLHSPSPNPLELLDKLDFFGQRPWRQNHQSIDPPDALKERDGILALQVQELKVDHSWLIIPLLSNAMSQFKKYKSARMKRYLMVQMGFEYCHAKDYSKALTLLSRVTFDYRQERWWLLLTNILSTELKCSFLTAKVQDYVTTSLELIGQHTLNSIEDKTRIQMNLIRVMSGNRPEAEPDCAEECTEKARQLWKVALATSDPQIITIEMHNIVPFVECKTQFTQSSFTTNQEITIQVFLRTTCQFPIRFSKLSILLNKQHYHGKCMLNDGNGITNDNTIAEGGDLYLVPGVIKTHSFSFVPDQSDVGQTLEITSVALELGNEGSICAILLWPRGGGDAVATPLSQQQISHRFPVKPITDPTDWRSIQVQASTKLVSRPAQLEVTVAHCSPCLLQEVYQMTVNICNKEDTPIKGVEFDLRMKSGQSEDSKTHLSVALDCKSGAQDSKSCSLKINFGDIAVGESITRDIFLQCDDVGIRNFVAQVSYDIEQSVNTHAITCRCEKSLIVDIDVVKPFDVNLKMNSLLFAPVACIHSDEPFLIQAEMSCLSPWTIEILNTELNLSQSVRFTDDEVESQLKGLSVESDECVNECQCLVAYPTVSPSINLGSYVITWRRSSAGTTIPPVTTEVPLPVANIELVPVLVELLTPSCGYIQKVFPVTYEIHNRTPYSQELEFSMDNSDNFMFAGHKHVRILFKIASITIAMFLIYFFRFISECFRSQRSTCTTTLFRCSLVTWLFLGSMSTSSATLTAWMVRSRTCYPLTSSSARVEKKAAVEPPSSLFEIHFWSICILRFVFFCK
ncbi:hypothetical protein CAPTEDRAFT_179073 [Capitella teleta]|uniref:Trafficking protein particle complex subunit 11 domain-containing protein n=1 Tax=Capitella teleta TaxID=283909 RepID=R7TTF4_CAPTE|nr:hypothetical protein CAPTEDRAFT_179073 [Capitella teleta]|eukprot:ELT94290.1 hypothetical protein CAPTEDRAFT_179073 [Capitella teleta]